MLFRSDRKSTRLNSSHTIISYAVFCLKKKRNAALLPQVGQRAPPRPHAAAPRAADAGGRWGAGAPGGVLVRTRSVAGCFFFFSVAAPPRFSPFPPPAALPI